MIGSEPVGFGIQPQDPVGFRALNRGVQTLGPEGDLIRAMLLQKETPITLRESKGPSEFGVARPNFLSRGFTVGLNPQHLQSERDLVQTLAHEVPGHVGAVITGLGGEFTPSGIAPLDFARSLLKTGRQGGETLADLLAGIPLDRPATESQKLVAQRIREAILKKRK
jgi:hypothetical protein